MKGEKLSIDLTGGDGSTARVSCNGQDLRGLTGILVSVDPEEARATLEFCGVSLGLHDVPVEDALVSLCGKQYRLVEIGGSEDGGS